MNLRILVVDDHAFFREAVKSVLQQLGHAVAGAVNGADAVAQLEAEFFDVVLVDVFMPEKDGLETIMDLRSRFPEIRIVAMSGGGVAHAEDALKLAAQLGAAQVLKKPFTQADLVAVLEW